MFSTLRVKDILYGILIVGLLSWAGYTYTLKARLEAVEEKSSQLSGNAAAGNTAAKEVRSIYIDKEKANAALDQALEANPSWSDQPVPADVADLLRHDTNAARAVP